MAKGQYLAEICCVFLRPRVRHYEYRSLLFLTCAFVLLQHQNLSQHEYPRHFLQQRWRVLLVLLVSQELPDECREKNVARPG